MYPEHAIAQARALPLQPTATELAAAWTALTGLPVDCSSCNYRQRLYDLRKLLKSLDSSPAPTAPSPATPMDKYTFKREHKDKTVILEVPGVGTVSIKCEGEVDPATARRLVESKRGHLLENPPSLDEAPEGDDTPKLPGRARMNLAELKAQHLAETGTDAPEDAKRADIIAAIEAHRTAEAPTV